MTEKIYFEWNEAAFGGVIIQSVIKEEDMITSIMLRLKNQKEGSNLYENMEKVAIAHFVNRMKGLEVE